jgi:superfamily II DNA/RNA helicase
VTSFDALGVPARLSTVLADLGIETPTPIQAATLPDALSGRDVLGRGRTGSGKTYAFLLPLVARLSGGRRAASGRPRALVLAPTRELVLQIEASLKPLAAEAGLSVRTIFGGVGQNPQVTALRQGVDIVLACPGRLEDLVQQGHCDLSDVQVAVLDEADHMADLGFLPGVRRLLARTPKGGQRLFFSATLDAAVDGLVKQFLVDPVTHQVDSAQSPVAAMAHHVLQVDRERRLDVLVDLTSAPGRTVVFTRTKHGAKGLARQLNRSGVPAVELHGNLGQNVRTRNLEAFQEGRATVLVATDIAARGIHVDDVTLVVHADPPAEFKAYMHRSGRTARAGRAGTVVTLATPDQLSDVRALTKAAGIAPRTTRVPGPGHPVLSELAPGGRVLRGAFEPVTGAGQAGQQQPAARQGQPAARQGQQRSAAPQSGGRQRPAGAGRTGGAERGGQRAGGQQRSAGAPQRTGQQRPAAAAAQRPADTRRPVEQVGTAAGQRATDAAAPRRRRRSSRPAGAPQPHRTPPTH